MTNPFRNRPGYCLTCGCIRLSVSNTDGVCDGCHRDKEMGWTKYITGLCLRCNAPRQKGRPLCQFHQVQQTRANRERRRVAAQAVRA